jgi:lipopolysaccharide transport system permease protein
MTAIVEAYRDLVLVGQIQHGGELATASIVAMILISSGLWVYRRLRPAFADVL